MLRTATGQTGKDAYVFEMTRIANKLDALKAEWAKLQEQIAHELPEDATIEFSIATDQFPDATLRGSARRTVEITILQDVRSAAEKIRTLELA